jgi:hypothetical protein
VITKINVKKTPQASNVRFFKRMEAEALLAYRHVTKRLIKDIIYILREEKLAKSDDETRTGKLPKGWTGSINRITIDLNDRIAPMIDRYLKGFNWILFGDMSDKESKKIARELKLNRMFTPGSAISAYLHSIDSNREFYKDVYGSDPGFPKQLIKESMEAIPEVSSIALSQSFMNIKTGLLLALNAIVDAHNNDNVNDAFEKIQDLDDVDKEEIKKIGENLDEYIEASRIDIEMRRAARRLERPFVLGAQNTIAQASALGTHQALHEIYGARDQDMDLIWVCVEDEKVCNWCKPLSKNKDGTYKIYKLSDFKPAGYNYGKKRKEWKLALPKAHPSCRCEVIMKPRGWKIDNETLVKGE